MTTIGAAWKQRDKNNEPYLSCKIDEELLPLTIDETKRLAFFPVKEKKSDNAPDFRIVLYKPETDKEEEPKQDLTW